MKISELIAELQQAQQEHGDVDVWVVRSDMADYEPELTLSRGGAYMSAGLFIG